MNYEIVPTEKFYAIVKRLAKKYHSLADDLENLKQEILKNPLIGDDLGDNTRKVRMAIASKNKGKSGGARVITCSVLVSIDDTDIYLLTLYDKGKKDNITPNEIRQLKQDAGLLSSTL
ncbi:MAG: type II toxin-antitoxin system RelE/ParE family toxin [Tannerella sp.]|jgi:hypothetical protein|nr:type II toxin-antitoxin system RelE/ParE family toxin [Tannerella sp.]